MEYNFTNFQTNTDQNKIKTSVVSSSNLFSKIPVKSRKIFGTIIGVVLSVLLLFFGFQIIQGVFTRASDIAPRDVVITEITENSAVIEWATAIETQGVIEYGTTPTNLSFFAPETEKTKNHKVELTLLTPGTTYYFQIRIGDKVFDNAGVPWSFTTKSKGNTEVIQPSPTPSPITETKQSSSTPTPYQTLDLGDEKSSVPTSTPIPTKAVCDETDCAKIKEKLGKGCTTQDYIKCVLRLTGTSTPNPPNTPSPSPTP